MQEAKDGGSRGKKIKRWALRLMLVFVAILLVLPALVYAVMAITSALSRPSNPKTAKERGDSLLKLKNKVIMVVSAHPDDIDYWASGTMAKLHRNGNKIIMVLGTSGEKGADIPDLDKIREQEQREAGKIIGYDKIIFLRHPDRGLKADQQFKDELREIFKQYKPDILFAFDIDKEGLIYHHSDHRAAGIAAHEVAPEFKSIKEVYQYHTRAPNVIVNVSDVVGIKAKAMSAHQSVRGRSNGWMKVLAVFFIPLSFLERDRGRSYGLEGSYEKSLGVKYAEVFRVTKNHD